MRFCTILKISVPGFVSVFTDRRRAELNMEDAPHDSEHCTLQLHYVGTLQTATRTAHIYIPLRRLGTCLPTEIIPSLGRRTCPVLSRRCPEEVATITCCALDNNLYNEYRMVNRTSISL